MELKCFVKLSLKRLFVVMLLVDPVCEGVGPFFVELFDVLLEVEDLKSS